MSKKAKQQVPAEPIDQNRLALDWVDAVGILGAALIMTLVLRALGIDWDAMSTFGKKLLVAPFLPLFIAVPYLRRRYLGVPTRVVQSSLSLLGLVATLFIVFGMFAAAIAIAVLALGDHAGPFPTPLLTVAACGIGAVVLGGLVDRRRA